jgi:hypothetical protein
MKWLRRSRPSPALVVSLIALFVALGGTGYAAFKLPKNSVGTKQLKKKAVVSSKVKNHSLLAVDFKRGQLPAGPRGPQGPAGAKGADFTADTTLAPGKTLTGSWGVGGGPNGWASDAVQFRIPLASPPVASDYIPNAAAETANCPGPGHAAAGHLCVYRIEGTGVLSFSAIYSDDDGTSNAGASTNGFLIYLSSGATSLNYASGSWSVTAP